MMTDIDYEDYEDNTITLDEFMSKGYLQEVNRRVLHPLGLALSIVCEIDEEGVSHAVEFGPIWDYRDDQQGLYFGGDCANLEPKMRMVEEEWERRKPYRMDALGYMVQPIMGDNSD